MNYETEARWEVEGMKCLNCGHENTAEDVRMDDLGEHIICENCESSFDI